MSGAVLCKGWPDIKANCTSSIDLKESVSKWIMDLISPDSPSENMQSGEMPKVMIYTFYISNCIFGINSIRKKIHLGLV